MSRTPRLLAYVKWTFHSNNSEVYCIHLTEKFNLDMREHNIYSEICIYIKQNGSETDSYLKERSHRIPPS